MKKSRDVVITSEVDETQPLLNTTESSGGNHANLRYLDAFALLISIQIGSGIFSSPSQIDKHAASPGFALIIWLVSGLVAWTGAACYAELGAALPINGGMLEYIRYIFGDSLAFMASWIWIMAVKPSSVAILSITFGQYWTSIIFGSTFAANGWESKVIAVTGVVVLTSFNMISIDATTKMTRFFFLIKVSTLLLLVLCTLLFVCFGIHKGQDAPNTDWSSRNWFSNTKPSWKPGIWDNIGESTLAIYAGLWAFSGWTDANMVAGDMRNPARDLPRAIHTAQPFIICSFILANVCYYIVIPWSSMDANNTIAVTVGNSILSWPGSVAFAVLVSLACLGSINVNIYTTSRLVVSAAQARWVPRSLGKYDSLRSVRQRTDQITTIPISANIQTPIRAMTMSTIISIVYIIFGTFGFLVTFVGLAEYVFSCITIAGVIILRVREPQLHRPYKPNLIVALVFVVVSGFLVVYGAVKAPSQAGLLGVLLALGCIRGLYLNTGKGTKQADYTAAE